MPVLHAIKKGKLFRFSKRIRVNEYSTAVPEKIENQQATYPEILELSNRSIELRKKQAYYAKIKKLNTVEEKLIALNLPKFYGWPCFHIKEGIIPYNFMPLTQFITRTEIQEVDTLPVFSNDEKINKILRNVKEELEKVIVFENCYKNYSCELQTILKEEDQLPDLKIKEIKTNSLVNQINSALTRVLLNHCPHLLNSSVDYEPRLEAFWRVGGFYPTNEDKKLRESKGVIKERIEEHIDRYIQYFGRPILQLRNSLPLSTVKLEKKHKNENEETISNVVVKEEAPNYVNYPLQEYRYDPKTYLQIPRERRHGTVVPGFWPNDPRRFGILSYHSTNFMSEREFYDSTDAREALHCQAVLASYAWLYDQACFQGFSTFYDITYPFSTQTILTDGKSFSFYQYQLNTTVLHTDANSSENPLKNNCYGTLSQELYHNIENDEVKGWNDKVVLHLISLYMNTPQKKPDVNLTPYLHESEKVVANIKEDKKRLFLHRYYKYFNENRQRRLLAPEIYDWERIYKIENKRRVLDARKRFYEKFLDPINDRTIVEQVPAYVPKKFREAGKEKVKYEETFYPDAVPDYHEIV